jgi:hypothetical protein
MKLSKRILNISSFILTIVLLVIGTIGCATDLSLPQTNPAGSTYVVSTNSTITVAVTPYVTPTLHPEPSVKPSGLPSYAKWNPYKGAWYDSSWVELDPVTHEYKNLPQPTPTEYLTGKVAKQTMEEWIAQHKDSTDEVDMAIIKYYRALPNYIEKLKQEDPMKFESSSAWEVGQGEGGPLSILTDLGISGLQALLDRVQWENPLVVNIEIAVSYISRSRSSKIGFWDFQVAEWKRDFNERSSGAKGEIDGIVEDLARGAADEESIRIKFYTMGVLALPEVYNQVINQGNTGLIPYLPDILPLDKMSAYNIQAGTTDNTTLKQALADCVSDIEIIRTLHAN